MTKIVAKKTALPKREYYKLKQAADELNRFFNSDSNDSDQPVIDVDYLIYLGAMGSLPLFLLTETEIKVTNLYKLSEKKLLTKLNNNSPRINLKFIKPQRISVPVLPDKTLEDASTILKSRGHGIAFLRVSSELISEFELKGRSFIKESFDLRLQNVNMPFSTRDTQREEKRKEEIKHKYDALAKGMAKEIAETNLKIKKETKILDGLLKNTSSKLRIAINEIFLKEGEFSQPIFRTHFNIEALNMKFINDNYSEDQAKGIIEKLQYINLLYTANEKRELNRQCQLKLGDPKLVLIYKNEDLKFIQLSEVLNKIVKHHKEELGFWNYEIQKPEDQESDPFGEVITSDNLYIFNDHLELLKHNRNLLIEETKAIEAKVERLKKSDEILSDKEKVYFRGLLTNLKGIYKSQIDLPNATDKLMLMYFNRIIKDELKLSLENASDITKRLNEVLHEIEENITSPTVQKYINLIKLEINKIK